MVVVTGELRRQTAMQTVVPATDFSGPSQNFLLRIRWNKTEFASNQELSIQFSH
jgi:hypothetical protein